IFLPGLLILMGALPYWEAFRAHPRMQAAMQGVNAAVVGLLAMALYNPVWTSSVSTPLDFVIATTAFVLLIAWKAPPLAVVILCAAAGLALR
ncbi:MAG: chromate transporter, partial [Pseudomonadota bacterium]|nr:chromate transporter [Pseudomonadota bacterium]